MWSGGLTRDGRGVPAIASFVIVLVGVLAIGLVSGSALASEEKPKAETKPQGAKPAPQEIYPLDTCIVSGSKLGAMGDPVVYKYEGREIRFCCSGCVKKFADDPKTYLKKMDEAIIAKELPGYPLDTCIVTGYKFGANKEAPVNYIYNNHLVRFCCSSCLKTFEKDPGKYLRKLDEARQKQAQQSGAQGHTLIVPTTSKQAVAVEPYPLSKCLVSGEPLGPALVTYVHGSQEFKFCCMGCVDQFKKNPDKYVEMLKVEHTGTPVPTEGKGNCAGH